MRGLAVLTGLVFLISGPAGLADPAEPPASEEAILPGQPLPAERLIPAESDELAHVGEPMVYIGEQALFDYINGGAPQYIEYGYHEVASQELMLGDHTYVFDVYRMDDPLAAFGIYSTRAPLLGKPIGDFLFSAFTTYQGLVAHDSYLFDISAYESGDWTAGEMALLVEQAVSVMGPVKARPTEGAVILDQAPLAYLPVICRMPGSERLARGPVSLRAAVGAAGKGVFAEILKTLQTSVENQMQEQDVATSWWAVAGYHPQLDEDDHLAAETTLVMLMNEGDLSAVGLAADRVLAQQPTAGPLDPGRCWREENGETGYLVSSPGRVLLVTSTLGGEAFAAWASQLLDP